MATKKKVKSIVKDIKRKTRRKFSSEEKIRIVLEGLKGEESRASPSMLRRNGVEAKEIESFQTACKALSPALVHAPPNK